MPIICKNQGHSSDPYPLLWVRARQYMRAKHPEFEGMPSKELLIDLLLREAGF